MRVRSRILSLLTAIALCAAIVGPLPIAAAAASRPR